jgi:alcohol dehydrogenase class IV
VGAGIKAEVFDGVAVEPTDESIELAVAHARQQDWDCYVAVGGGSSIDTAKAVNLLTTHPGELLDLVTPPIGEGKAPWLPLKPLIAIPTTAGTGSESTTICVVDLLRQHLKAGISHTSLRPVLAVVDPLTTLTLPAEVTAASGMDVLSHALESYTSIPYDSKPAPDDVAKRPAFCGSNPISDVWCEMALKLVGANLRRAVMNGRDRAARHQMALASTYAGTGFGNAGTHLPHANAYPIAGAVKDYRATGYPEMPMVPHGQAVSVTAPQVFRWTYPGDPERHLRAAELLSGRTFTATDGADALAHVLRELMADIGIPSSLSDFGYERSDVDTLVEGTLKQTRQLAVVPRPVTREALSSIYADSF